MPFGQVPVLEADGKVLSQSIAIARYLAREHGIAGKNAWESALADMYVDAIGDLTTGTFLHQTWVSLLFWKYFETSPGLRPVLIEADAEKQKDITQQFLNDTVAPYMEIVEKHLEKNGTGFLVGSEVSWENVLVYE